MPEDEKPIEEAPEIKGGEEEALPFTDEQIEQQVEEAGAGARVNVLDPDFLLIFMAAFLFDALDILVDLLPLVIPPVRVAAELINTPLDIIAFAAVGGWIYWRTNRIAQKKKEKIAQFRKTAEKRIAGLQQKLAQRLPSPLKKMLLRGGVSFLGELLPLIETVIPFWIISVFLTLREK